ncbi:MAG: zinc-dependent peptidase [Gammaproteobacteria bacterium]|nr:zinc-dependent peptidase [Gammaproteobacteria bacterium]
MLRVLREHSIADETWHGVSQRLPLLQPLTAIERARLRELTTLFLHQKDFTGVQGLVIDDEIRITIAAQACLEILELGLDAFAGWLEIIVYPGAFRVTQETLDDAGVVHQQDNSLSGESWSRGPVILSWQDVQEDSFSLRPGHNVVLHEFAHKLDMLNQRANGMPPLHPDMPIKAWTEALSQAYENLQQRLENHQPTINAYAATNPAEFFAVICEYFFTAPDILWQHCPDVYQQLKAWFKQDPLARKRLN